jgi:hypothetical protein
MSQPINPWIIVNDIETAATHLDAKILTIGATVGNILTGEQGRTFYQRITIGSQPGRRVSGETLEGFWGQQKMDNPDAYNEAFGNGPLYPREHLKYALNEFNTFVLDANREYGNDQQKGMLVFGNGPEFDNAIIMHAMQSLDITSAWPHSLNESVRSFRTVSRLLTGADLKIDKYPPDLIKHHALHDAIIEFRVLHATLANLFTACKPCHSP